MRSRGLSFADAVNLLDGESEAVGVLGNLAGVAAGTVTVASAGTIDFFALRDQVVRWGNSAVRSWRDRVIGLSRFDRTDRLIAAHTVIVVVAFFEALDEWLAESGVGPGRARLTAAEQSSVATGEPAPESYWKMIDSLIAQPAPFPSPLVPFETLQNRVELHHKALGLRVARFLDVPHDVSGLAGRAAARYVTFYRRLALEIPEFRLWSDLAGDQATRELIREAIAELRGGHAAADGVRAGLTRRYEAQLDKPILHTADAPLDVVLPTLRQGYLEPAGRADTAGPGDLPATAAWWASAVPVADVQSFVLAHLTTAAATDQPLVILGQPGSGKSVLTRVLSARLTLADFLPIRVELRNVRADSPIQTQIEEALYLLLGEQVSWPEVVRRAGTALPVVIMDGFDELLQATGQNWADYLEQLRDFQQREAELGRPVAVLVTSRTVVADRARFPAHTVVVRLDPFDESQVEAWLAAWNGLNRDRLAARGLRPLSTEAVLAHPHLAGQPLLLLLLALYDSRANQLLELDPGLGRVELYERLFQDFFERQVDKFGTGMSPEQRAAEVAAEWRRLSAVAVAMHNRGRDVILEPELEDDLRHLLGPDDWSPGPAGAANRPLTAGQLLVGRFFFVHESRASRDTGAAERSFEFLHATFAEFLAARHIVTALTELAEDRAHLRRRPGATLDAGFFHALTSFASVTRRAPLWEFAQGMLARLDAGTRHGCRDLVLELLPDAGFPHPRWTLATYEPERRTLAGRQAAFSANLVCLAVALADGPLDATDLVGEPVVINWRRLALLWMGQLEPEDARRLWQALRVDWDLTTDPTRLRVRLEDGAAVHLIASLPWPPEDRPAAGENHAPWDLAMPAESTTGRLLRKSAFAQTGFDTRELIYVMAPFWKRFGDMSSAQFGSRREYDARVLSELLLGDFATDDPQTRGELYATLLATAPPDLRAILLDRLGREPAPVEPRWLKPIFERYLPGTDDDERRIASEALVRLSAQPKGKG